MLFQSIQAERHKLKHSPVWLAFFILPIIPAIMGTFNYVQNIGILQDKWYSLWTQHTLFSCYFFLPAMIGIYASYLYRLEHMNHNWNSVMTVPIPFLYHYISKLIIACYMVFMTQLWMGVLYIISGKLLKLEGPIPPELFEWLLFGAVGGIVICAVQLCLSLVIRSFAVPVGIAIMGGIGGIAALSTGYGVMYPYSLISLGMRANSPGGPMQCNTENFLLNSVIYVVLSIFFVIIWRKNRDILAT